MSLLTFVDVQYLHDVWPWVREGLKVVQRRGGGRWLPEDVYTALRVTPPNTFLFMIGERNPIGQHDGFVVVQRHVQSEGPVFHVWALYGRLWHLRPQIRDALDHLARTAGCRVIEFRSKRKAWLAEGYAQPVATVYRREL